MNATQISSAIRETVLPDQLRAASWTEANQACLAMEFARLRRRLGTSLPASGDDDEAQAALQELRESLDPPAAIDQLAETFSLSEFERQIVLLAAGIEMDSALARQVSEWQGGERRGSISFGMALGTLDHPHWSALAPSASLRSARLIEMESGFGLTAAPLRIDERILHYLAGVNRLDSRLEPLMQERVYPHWIADEHAGLAGEIVSLPGIESAQAPIIHLSGNDASGQEDVAALVAHRQGRQLQVLPFENFPAPGSGDSASDDPAHSAAQFVALWTRDAALLPAMLIVQCAAAQPSAAALKAIERLPVPLVVASREPLRLTRPSVRYTVNRPEPASQKRLWSMALGPAGAKDMNDSGNLIDDLAEQFRLSAQTIASVGAAAHGARESESSVVPDVTERLWGACRSLSRPRLEDLAERIVPASEWDDLILPAMQKDTLRRLADQARFRMTVYESWGFAARGRRGLGISALFAGPSGTGKTLAAEVLAKELRLDLFRIDLSAVVSKYIGESEKNLRQVFDAAEEGGVLLLFDEADALFGKRAEVKDSHDRYANIEVSYLLQRMENFQGLAVLTTNLKSSLDKAFQRRLRFSVDFPFPGPLEREAIWRRVFPAQAPTQGLDPGLLAQLRMTGGSIRNIALNAAFLAAGERVPIAMVHVLRAAKQEAMKVERPLAEAEIRGWA
ncbi:ATP-binding protein [Paraburkholderia sp. CI3]|uniref:ATP-binding protein n=1 Tax=Paraburkholderia sp. CI3 TaxID=2991060 RepID=UPI003D215E86